MIQTRITKMLSAALQTDSVPALAVGGTAQLLSVCLSVCL